MRLLLCNVFKLNMILTVEIFVLIAAVFLLSYISRHQLNKWYRYTATGIVIFLGLIVLCTIVNAFCISCCKRSGKECKFNSESSCCHRNESCDKGHYGKKDKCERYSRCDKDKHSHHERDGKKDWQKDHSSEEHANDTTVSQ